MREKEAEIKKAIERGTDYTKAKITVSELVEQYLKQYQKIHQEKQHTIATYKDTLNRINRYSFARMEIGEVRTRHAKDFMQQLKNDVGYGTIELAKTVLKQAFQSAVEDEILVKNPFVFTLSKVAQNDSVIRKGLTHEQKEQFLNFVWNSKRWRKWYDEIVILLGTGLRVSELYGLTKTDIDLKAGTIRVERQLSKDKGEYKLTLPKSKAGVRTVPITDDGTCRALERTLQNRQTPKVETILRDAQGQLHGGFLFLNREGKPQISKGIQAAIHKMEVEYNATHTEAIEISPHVLRHTFCTEMVELGFNPKALQYIMGHSSISETMDTYTNYGYDNIKGEAERIRNQRNTTPLSTPITPNSTPIQNSSL